MPEMAVREDPMRQGRGASNHPSSRLGFGLLTIGPLIVLASILQGGTRDVLADHLGGGWSSVALHSGNINGCTASAQFPPNPAYTQTLYNSNTAPSQGQHTVNVPGGTI